MKMRILIAAIAVVLLCGAAVTWSQWHRAGESDSEKPSAEQAASTAAANENLVILGDGKLASLDIRVEEAAPHPMQDLHVVPGRIQYDSRKRIEIPAVAGGILTQVAIMPGDRVTKGQVLAVVSSPEVGTARTEVHHSRENWELATKKREWEDQIAQNVSALIKEFKTGVSESALDKRYQEIEKRFQGKTLGKSRDDLMSAYARYLLAETLAKDSNAAGATVLPTVTILQRVAERRSAEAALKAACEQAGFDVQRQKRMAEIDEGDALRRLNISIEQLKTLLGYWPDPVSEEATSGDVLSRVEIRAPFAGTIEEKRVAQSARVQKLDTLFVLADTKNLWVAADIREQDWRALGISVGQDLTVETPALPGRQLTARVSYVGRQVVPETNSVPLIAEIANADGLLRPGLFVRVVIPVGSSKNLLCIPAAAVVSHENVKFVFVQEGPKTFRRVDVVTGMQTDQWVEITQGIKAGAPVVVQGAMMLKSELLVEKLSKED